MHTLRLFGKWTSHCKMAQATINKKMICNPLGKTPTLLSSNLFLSDKRSPSIVKIAKVSCRNVLDFASRALIAVTFSSEQRTMITTLIATVHFLASLALAMVLLNSVVVILTSTLHLAFTPLTRKGKQRKCKTYST